MLTALEVITADWLTVTLREAGVIKNARISSFEMKKLQGRQESVTSELTHLVLTCDTNANYFPQTVIVKISSANHSIKMDYIYSNETEVRFYQQIANQIELRTPRVYYHAINMESGKSALLLEDLTHLTSTVDNWADCSLRPRQFILLK